MLKIKIGHPGDQATMLARDCEWLSYLHGMVEDSETPMTESGKILYYLDANGRYECVEDLLRLLQHAERIGMLQRIVLLEEPLAEELVVDVGGVPARLAADESLHSVDDVALRAEQGYGAIAVKAAGKTIPYKIVARRPGDVATVYADTKKAADELGWTAELGLDEMCRDLWTWQSANPMGFVDGSAEL